MKRKPKVDRNAGFGAIRHLLEVNNEFETEQDHKDLALIRQLRADLTSILTVDDRRPADWTLSEASAILKTVVEFIGNLIDEKTPTDDGQVLVIEDQVTLILSDLQKCLDDIPKGTVDQRLIPEKRTTGYSSIELDFIKILVTTAPIIQTVENNKKGRLEKKITLLQACEILAKGLKKRGIKFRDEPMTAEKLLGFKRMPPGKRRVK